MTTPTIDALWKGYQIGQGSADHTAKEVFAEVIGPVLRDLVAALEENERLRAALKEANDTCRSAYQVASRGGKDTDMEAWKFAIQKSLKAQHMVMHPEQYAEDRLIHTKGEPR